VVSTSGAAVATLQAKAGALEAELERSRAEARSLASECEEWREKYRAAVGTPAHSHSSALPAGASSGSASASASAAENARLTEELEGKGKVIAELIEMNQLNHRAIEELKAKASDRKQENATLRAQLKQNTRGAERAAHAVRRFNELATDVAAVERWARATASSGRSVDPLVVVEKLVAIDRGFEPPAAAATSSYAYGTGSGGAHDAYPTADRVNSSFGGSSAADSGAAGGGYLSVSPDRPGRR
jgi:FtsZ-binding cell division protein ZapB